MDTEVSPVNRTESPTSKTDPVSDNVRKLEVTRRTRKFERIKVADKSVAELPKGPPVTSTNGSEIELLIEVTTKSTVLETASKVPVVLAPRIVPTASVVDALTVDSTVLAPEGLTTDANEKAMSWPPVNRPELNDTVSTEPAKLAVPAAPVNGDVNVTGVPETQDKPAPLSVMMMLPF